MKTTWIITCLFILLSAFAMGQNKKGQKEIHAPVNPWNLIMFKSYYLQYEQFLTPKYSVTATAGYQGDSFMHSYFSNSIVNGYRMDIGGRAYYKGETQKYFRPYLGVNFTVERTSIQLRERSNVSVPKDSLNTKGFSFGPELTAGVKFVILKRIIITPAIGLRYYFSTVKTEKLSQNPKYWAFDDWDNTSLDWEKNRSVDVGLTNYRRGLSPIIYLNLGFAMKL